MAQDVPRIGQDGSGWPRTAARGTKISPRWATTAQDESEMATYGPKMGRESVKSKEDEGRWVKSGSSPRRKRKIKRERERQREKEREREREKERERKRDREREKERERERKRGDREIMGERDR